MANVLSRQPVVASSSDSDGFNKKSSSGHMQCMIQLCNVQLRAG